jgi:hypothetical protein
MNRQRLYADNLALLEQGHQEVQLDALRRMHGAKLIELNERRRDARNLGQSVKELSDGVKGKEQQAVALEQHIQRMSQLLERKKQLASYESEYEQRQRYYIQESERVDAKLFPDVSRAKRNSCKGVIVAPDGLRFQSDRISDLLKGLADDGYLCFSFNVDLNEVIERGADGFYEYKDEALLLGWLTKQKIAPTILCTWVLQSAWFDLLPNKTIWYDVCDHEDVLWGMDATSRLKHYGLLKEAGLVTYSNRNWKKYVAARQDAIELESRSDKHAISCISACLEV